MVKGENVDDLVKAVVMYRVSNGMKTGNPLEEITEYYSKTFPFTVEKCQETIDGYRAVLKDRIHAWINDEWKIPCYGSADPDVVTARHDLCLQCPFRRTPDALEGPEDQECDRRMLLMARGAPGPNELGWCALHEWDNRLAYLWPKDKVKPILDSQCPWPR